MTSPTDPTSATPVTDALQRIRFEGCECVVSSPEEIEALELRAIEAEKVAQELADFIVNDPEPFQPDDEQSTNKDWKEYFKDKAAWEARRDNLLARHQAYLAQQGEGKK